MTYQIEEKRWLGREDVEEPLLADHEKETEDIDLEETGTRSRSSFHWALQMPAFLIGLIMTQLAMYVLGFNTPFMLMLGRSANPHHRLGLPGHQILSNVVQGLSTYSTGRGLSPLEAFFKRVEENEERFLSVPDPQRAKAALKEYSKSLHYAGSERDREIALDLQKEWATLLGADAGDTQRFESGSSEAIEQLTGHRLPIRTWTDTYYVWLNYVRNNSLVLTSSVDANDVVASLDLAEDVLEEDPTSARGNRPFHGYSKPGQASGPIVYAGLCTVDDFALLKKRGVKVKGAITLCRYGGPFRGLKVRASALHGAVGTLIYSDPLEDGQMTLVDGKKAYPDGPARQPSAVQRGSVQALSFYPGDPGTPGQPSYKNATRLDPDDADSLPKIPSLPISYKNAKVLLDALEGHGMDTAEFESENSKWVGKVPDVESYFTGPSALVAHMDNDMTPIEPKPIWNTYAMIPGHIEDEVVVIGNHLDSWTFAADPSSGTAAMHEVVAGLGELTRSGWKPLRSILICGWDGEEYGLVGSTEFGEDYAKWLQDHAVAYFNTDVAAAGSSLKIQGSPSLAKLYAAVSHQVEDPAQAGKLLNITSLGALGSGSDYSVFLQHLGIASSDVGYAPSPAHGDPVYHYHSNFDSFAWMEKYGDPEFRRITTISKIVGLATLKTSSSLFLPIDVADYARALEGYVDKVEDTYRKSRLAQSATRSSQISFGKLRKQVKDLQATAAHVEQAKDRLTLKLTRGVDDQKLQRIFHRAARINRSLRLFEQAFISEQGLKQRPWYRSLVAGPGRWLGYGATPLPALTEAITLDQSLEDARYELERVREAVKDAGRVLKQGLGRRECHSWARKLKCAWNRIWA